ncbi:MAG: 4-hydroxythreonine-4-phosphate dehydrogenase PdxA [Marinilabiliales bacterium]|nr:4-hydroxythreonine-4-phosphate dehydrogenase PdxA [Marinilabiliales bacterium]
MRGTGKAGIRGKSPPWGEGGLRRSEESHRIGDGRRDRRDGHGRPTQQGSAEPRGIPLHWAYGNLRRVHKDQGLRYGARRRAPCGWSTSPPMYPLRPACDNVKKERVYAVVKLAYNAMRDFGIERPRIGVAGLNPRASDGGLFGCEEVEEILPPLKSQGEGIVVDGPIPPDTLFSKALGRQYDIVVAMYHDQATYPSSW